MGITKRAKEIEVFREKVYYYISQYTCPSCKIEYRNGSIPKNILVFMCNCGQKLKIKQ